VELRVHEWAPGAAEARSPVTNGLYPRPGPLPNATVAWRAWTGKTRPGFFWQGEAAGVAWRARSLSRTMRTSARSACSMVAP